MKLRIAALIVFLTASFCQICRSYPQARTGTTGSLVNQAAPTLNAIEAQSEQDYQTQQAQALAAARAQAMRTAYANAAAEARWDDAVKKLTDARDKALKELDNESKNKLADILLKENDLNFRVRQYSNDVFRADSAAEHQQKLEQYQPTDPWRMVDGKTYYAKGKDWVEFTGEILEVQPSGILIHGHFGPPLGDNMGERDYFVANFPHKVADGEQITSNMQFNAFFLNDTTLVITNNNRINGGVHTVRELDYGVVITNPPPELASKQKILPLHIGGRDPDFERKMAGFQQELDDLAKANDQVKIDYEKKSAALRADCEAKIVQLRETFIKEKKDAAAAKAKEIDGKVLKYNQEQADKGDPVGLLRMGERYRDGQGVPKDLAKARDYLQKAADAGSPTAADELKSLPSEDPNRSASRQN